MLQFDAEKGSQSKKAIEVKVPIKHTSAENGQLFIFCWNGFELIDVSREMTPRIVDNAVSLKISQACR